MSLPASQQRALGSIEGRLRAADPRLASMFVIFARLNVGEPLATEHLAVRRPRLRWLRPRLGTFAVVLIPAMFIAMVVAGALAGGRLSPRACAGDHTAGASSILVQSSCQLSADTTAVKAATVMTPATPAGTEIPACIALVRHGRSAREWVC
jgi:hypothetical protein